MKSIWINIAFIFLVSTGVAPVLAGTEYCPEDDMIDYFDMSIEELMEIEISSSARRTQPLSRASNAVYVITAEDIRQAGPVRIEELLRQVPGMDVFCTDGVTTVVGARGYVKWNNQRMQVLLDGRPLYDPYFGGSLFFVNPIFLDNIDRIEVIRGSAGVTWGVNALNGVINVVTKKASETQGLDTYAAVGNREFVQGHVRVGGMNDTVAWRGTVGGSSSSGFSNGDVVDYNDAYKPFEITGRADVTLSEDTTLQLTGGNKISSYENHETFAGRSIQYMNALWNKKISDDSEWQIRWAESFIARTHNWNDVDTHSHESIFEIQHNWVLDRHNIVWGIDYTRDDYDSIQWGAVANTIPEDFSNDQGSLFVEDEITITDRLWLTLGLRGHHNELTHADWAGRAALVYEALPNHILRGAVSRSFRRPTLWESFKYDPDYWELQGNASLDNEILISYELGYRGQLRDNLSLNIEGYLNKDKNMIAIQTDQTTWEKQYENTYDVTTYGVETSLEWRPRLDWLVRGFHAYKHQTHRGQLTNWVDGETEVYLPPKHRIGLTNRFNLDEATTLNTQLYWTDTSTSYLEYIQGHPFWRLDLRLSHRFNDTTEVAGGVNNLIDHYHYEGGYDWDTGEYIEVPRFFYLQLHHKF